MPFVKITRANRINGKSVGPGDIIQVHESVANMLIKTNHAEPLGDGAKFETTDFKESTRGKGWTLEKT